VPPPPLTKTASYTYACNSYGAILILASCWNVHVTTCMYSIQGWIKRGVVWLQLSIPLLHSTSYSHKDHA